MNNLTFGEVIRQTIRVSNTSDTEKIYDVSADITYMRGILSDAQNGVVVYEGNEVATFYAGNAEGHLSVNFNGYADVDKGSVLNTIDAFIKNAKLLNA